jgi:hypothetical protein
VVEDVQICRDKEEDIEVSGDNDADEAGYGGKKWMEDETIWWKVERGSVLKKTDIKRW